MNQSFKSSITAGMLALAITLTALPAPSARAQTTAELQAQINVLLAKIQQLQSQTQTQATVQLNITRDLAEGASGADVKTLQQFLNSDPSTVVALSGVGSKGNETTFFGPATKAAVIKFQNKYRTQVLSPAGLSQGTGFVGALTRAHINNLGKTTTSTVTTNPDTTPTTPSTSVIQEEGDITVTRGSEHTNTLELAGGYDEIYSVQVKAEDSLMAINRLDFVFDKDVSRYIDSFVLYQDGVKVTTVKATDSNVTKIDDAYRLRFSNISVLIKKNEKSTLVLEAKALKSLQSKRQADTLSVYMPRSGVRAVDTAKISSIEPESNLGSRSFDFRDAEDDGAITVSLADKSPNSGAIQVKANSNTTGATLLIADMKVADSDLDIQKVYIKVDSTNSTVTDVVRSLSLVYNGKTIAIENVVRNTGSAIAGTDEDGNAYTIIETGEYYAYFEKLKDLSLDEGDTEQITVKAEFYKQSGRYQNGANVTLTIRAVQGENVHGKVIKNGNLTTGDNQTFTLHIDGLAFTMVSQNANTQGTLSRTGIFTLAYDVTAFGSDIYVPYGTGRQTGTTTVGTVGTEYSIVNGNGERYALGTAVESISIKDTKKENGYFKISNGTTRRVTLQISIDNTGAVSDFYRAKLESFRFKTGSPTGTEFITTSGFNDFETDVTSIKS